MSFSISLHIAKAVPSLKSLSRSPTPKLNQKAIPSTIQEPLKHSGLNKSTLAIQLGAILATVNEQTALAVTGVNYEEDLPWTLTQLGVVAFFYFIVIPPIILNWIRIRSFRSKLLETYLQYMFVFIFFPGILLWAPFLNFRKFPRDPNMKYPWSKPEDPSKIPKGFPKYPFAKPEDYS